MATLRDFVSEKELKFPNQGGYWTKTELSDSGYSGTTGPELGDTFFNFEKHFIYNGTEYSYKLEQTWSKIHSYPDPVPQAFYPIISIFLDLDSQSVPGCEYVIGYNQWWDYTIKRVPQEGGGYAEIRDDFNTGAFSNYKLDTKISGDLAVTGYTDNEYEFSQYYDSENNYVQEGFDVKAKQVYPEPSGYDIYWYKEDAYANILYSRSWTEPQYITGNPAYGDYTLGFSNIFDSHNNAQYTEQTPMLLSLDTNIPIIVFDHSYYQSHVYEISNAFKAYKEEDGDLTRFSQYVSDGHAVICNGYVAPSVTANTKSFQCYSDVYNGYWDVDEVKQETFKEYRYLQVFVAPNGAYPEPRVSLYKDRSGGELRAKIKVYGDIKQYRYSEDGGNNWTTVTAESASQVLTLPYEYVFYKRTNELGWLTYDKNHGGNMLLFDTEALCDDGSPYLASDYDEKNFYYPATNNTGMDELTTLMGTTGLQNGFCERYILNKADIDAIANDLLSSGGMSDNLKKGVEMLGENPINAVHGLMYFPVNVATLFNAMTSNTIFIGGYSIQTPSAMKMTGYNGYFDIGAMQILESFPSGDYRNYEPYCNLNIYLPFVGLEQLKMNKYVGKTLSIRYYLDVTSGECMACLFADGLLTDYFIGNMGISLSITLNDYSQYAGAHISGMKAAIGNQISLNPATQLSNLHTDVTLAGGGLDKLGSASVFNVSSNALSNFATTKGTDSSMLNHYLPNYVYVIFEIVETDETKNLSTLEGRRSNASGNLGSFSGYLQVEDVQLKCGIATENEKNEIKQLLHSGIYI